MKIFKKYVSIVMLLTLLLTPSMVQLMHALDSDHLESEICISEDSQHLHDHEAECELCKFHFNTFTVNELNIVNFTSLSKIDSLESFYTSLQNTFNLTSLLRGPPALV